MLRCLPALLLIGLLIGSGCGRSEHAQIASEEVLPPTKSAEVNHDSGDDIGAWSMQYYLDPDPDRIPWFLREVESQGLLPRESTAGPMIGFLSQVMAQNPERLSEWFPPDDRVFPDERAIYYRALWQADIAEAKTILDDVQERGPDELGQQLIEMRATSPRPILEWPVRSPADLDVLWGAFFATGDVRYIEAIISVIERSASEYEIVIQAAAVWSLRSNARQHELVYRTCKDHVENSARPSSDDLKQIVESASEYWP